MDEKQWAPISKKFTRPPLPIYSLGIVQKKDLYWLDVYNKYYMRFLGYLKSINEPDKLKNAVAKSVADVITFNDWSSDRGFFVPRDKVDDYELPSILRRFGPNPDYKETELTNSESYKYIWKIIFDEMSRQNTPNMSNSQKDASVMFYIELGNKNMPYKDIETAVKHFESLEVKFITTNKDFNTDTRRIITGITLCKIISTFAFNYSTFKKRYKFNFTNHLFWDNHTRLLKYDSATFTFTLHSGESSDGDKVDCGLSSVDYYASNMRCLLHSMLCELSKNYPEDRVRGIKDRITSLWESQS